MRFTGYHFHRQIQFQLHHFTTIAHQINRTALCMFSRSQIIKPFHLVQCENDSFISFFLCLRIRILCWTRILTLICMSFWCKPKLRLQSHQLSTFEKRVIKCRRTNDANPLGFFAKTDAWTQTQLVTVHISLHAFQIPFYNCSNIPLGDPSTLLFSWFFFRNPTQTQNSTEFYVICKKFLSFFRTNNFFRCHKIGISYFVLSLAAQVFSAPFDAVFYLM